MASALGLEVVTPEKQVLSTTADWVTLPGTVGELGVLSEHIPLITTLDSGALVYDQNGTRKAIAIHWGYAQVDNNKLTVLAELAETAEEIDMARAKAAEQKARELLKAEYGDSEEEALRMKRYELKLQRAVIRQQVASHQ